MAAGLRIRQSYLEAIEDGRVADLPGNAYALGFLRTYAATLGLNPDDLTRRFRAEVAEVNAKTELSFPAPVPDRGVPAGVVVVLGLVLAIGAYVGWYQLADRSAPPNPVTAVPERLARLADPTALAPPHPPAASASSAPVASIGAAPASAPAGVPSGPPPAAVATATVPVPAVTQPRGTLPASTLPVPATTTGTATVSPPAVPASPPATTPSSGGSPASDAALAAVASLAPPANAATRPVPPLPGTIIVHATAPAWIEVRDSTGAVVFTKLMQPGESWTVPRQPGLVLTTGNAGGTELIVDGRPAPPLGGPGVVVRGQPLDAGLIKSGALPAQIAAAAAGVPAYVPASIHATQSTDPTQ